MSTLEQQVPPIFYLFNDLNVQMLTLINELFNIILMFIKICACCILIIYF